MNWQTAELGAVHAPAVLLLPNQFQRASNSWGEQLQEVVLQQSALVWVMMTGGIVGGVRTGWVTIV